MRTGLGTIMGRCNEIVGCFNTDPDEFDPIFMQGPEDVMRKNFWQRCLTSSQPVLPASTSSGRTTAVIEGQHRAGVEAAPAVAGVIDTTAGMAVRAMIRAAMES
jgi:hypothetical protein